MANDSTFMQMNSHDPAFTTYMNDNTFDLIFIDGDHSYEGVKNDYLVSKNSGNIFVFHDIINDACPGVVQFWNELKTSSLYDFHEFVDQYDDVWNNTHKKYLGIGVAVKKRST